MEKILSYDGTPIAAYRSGTGPPLILVHGTGGANPAAWPAFPALAEHFTVVAVDRRGHGESGDGPTYSIEREFEDIAAFVDSLGEPANLLGHSFGGLCALEAALLTQNIRRLILYEALSPSIPGKPAYPEGLIDRLQTLLDSGDREGVLAGHYLENAGLTPGEIKQMRSSPAWPARLAAAHTIPRELRADERYIFEAPRFKDLHVPVLLLAGGDSPDPLKVGTDIIARALPHCSVSVMPRQRHIAMYTAPDLFQNKVLAFFQ